MTQWIGLVLDVILIAVVGVGIFHILRLIVQLKDLRAGRVEMERFLREFNGAIMRAEAGIKSLRAAARESGDDLEKLVSKAVMVRDELNFIVQSADGVAARLSVAASKVMHAATAPDAPSASEPQAKIKSTPAAAKTETPPASRAEKELLQALQKLS